MPELDPIASAREIWVANGWAEAARGMAAITSVMRAHQLFLARANEALRPFDLTFPRYEVLAWLVWQSDEGTRSLKELSELSQVTPATITKAVARLERAGLIRRLAHPKDARTTLARITPRGRRVVARSTEALNTQVFEAVDLSADQLDQLFGLLLQARIGAGDLVTDSDADSAADDDATAAVG